MNLRPYQHKLVNNAIALKREGKKSALAVMPTGCHAKGQGVLMFDGRIKAVEDVKVGDKLMGPDSRPRLVLQLARGRGQMVRILPTKGDPFIVNLDHVLSLVQTSDHGKPKFPCQRRGGTIVDVTVREWLTWSKTKKHIHKLFRAAVDFDNEEFAPKVDAYAAGVLLGDGSLRHSIGVTTADSEIVSAVHALAKEFDSTVRRDSAGGRSSTWFIVKPKDGRVQSELINHLRAYGLRWGQTCHTKHVPFRYLTATRAQRLDILAGLIDTDGSPVDRGGYDFISASQQLSKDVAYLARSVGLAAYIRECVKSDQHGTAGTYWRVSISGDCQIVPCRIARKRQGMRIQKKNVLRTGFTVEVLGEDDFYGFSLSGDGRFLLDDFTVTHNTGKTVCFASLIARMPEFAPGKRALVLAHREELIHQAADKIHKITGERPDIEMAGLHADVSMYHRSNVVVASKDTLRGKRLSKFKPEDFALIITDEAHHAIAQSYRGIFDHFASAFHLGVTATPDRTDEVALGKVFESVAMVYELPNAIEDGWLCPIVQQSVEVHGLDYSDVRTTAGDLNGRDLAEVMSNEQILQQVADATIRLSKGRKTLVFAPPGFKKQGDNAFRTSERLTEIFNRHDEGCARLVMGTTPTDERASVLRDYRDGKFPILVNVGVFCLDTETEILTADGWVGIDGMTYDHEVANWEHGRIFFEKPRYILRRDRAPDEKMIVLETKNRSIRVTDKHRMLYRTAQQGQFHIAHAGVLVGKKIELPICGCADPLPLLAPIPCSNERSHAARVQANAYALRKNKGLSHAASVAEATSRIAQRDSMRHKNPRDLSLDECRLIGFWLGDGTRTPLRSGGIEHVLAQSVHCPRIAEWIDRVLTGAGIDFIRRHKKRSHYGEHFTWSLPRGTGFGSQKRNGIFAIEPYLNKNGSPLYWGLSSEQFDALIHGLHIADGDHGDSVKVPASIRVCGVNRKLFDLLQAIAVCRGYRANINTDKHVRKAHHKNLIRLSLSKRPVHHVTTGHALQVEDGWKAERVWCVTSTSGNIITRRRGTVTVTGNTEGFDDPSIEVVAMARATKSRSLYSQIVGRGTRPLPGIVDGVESAEVRRAAIASSRKPVCEVLDFEGNAGNHKLVHVADILGGNYTDAEVALAEKKVRAAGGAVNVQESLEEARDEIRRKAEFEKMRRAAIKGRAQYSLRQVDPFEEMHMYRPVRRGWDRAEPATEKQAKLLSKYKLYQPGMSKREASALIGKLADNGWRKPAAVPA